MFDPNAAASAESGVFGLPYTEAESSLVLLPVPWEATTSYGGGTSRGPEAILQASRQVDLYDLDVLRPYEAGICMLPESDDVRGWNETAKAEAQRVIAVGGAVEGHPELKTSLHSVNALGLRLNQYVYGESRRLLAAGKILGVVGGDHSVPFGALQAVGERHPGFGILHFDAHADLRHAYEGFSWSHASIMHNVVESIPQLGALVQVGIRDLCEQEADYAASKVEKIRMFPDRDLSRRRFEGAFFGAIAREIVGCLPNEVWISFDIDGLDPKLCPHTGTPVPGGLEFQEAAYLIAQVARSGRRIIGFDLNEVSPGPDDGDEWDANVGARMLYKLCAWTLASQSKAKLL
jgi:agmatinase